MTAVIKYIVCGLTLPCSRSLVCVSSRPTNQTKLIVTQQWQYVKPKAIYARTCQMENNLIDSNNLCSLYQYVNEKIISLCGIGCLKRDDGSLITNLQEKAELLNKYFSSVFTTDDGCSPILSIAFSQVKVCPPRHSTYPKCSKS